MASPTKEMEKPPGFDSWNPAFRGAYRKGYEAKRAGLSEDDCPYKDKRKHDGRLTFSRAFERTWLEGFNVK